MTQMFPRNSAGFTVELWKPDTSAEDLEPDYDDSLPQWADYTTSRTTGLLSTRRLSTRNSN